MNTSAKLMFFCGKMAAGKSTLARKLAVRENALLLVQDDFLNALFPGEITDIPGFIKCSSRLKNALTPHVCALLSKGISVVLDFPGNTKVQRAWFRELIERANVEHELHFVDASDAMCKSRLRGRSAGSVAGTQPHARDSMSLRTELVGTSTAQPKAVQWWCSFLVLGLLCAGCGGGTAVPQVNNSPPAVSITSPVSGATVSGTITITTNVSANTTSVQFSVDGTGAGAAVTSAPFSFSLNTATLSNGSHSLTASAGTAAGQTATSAAISINVNNAAPPTISITSPTSAPFGHVIVVVEENVNYSDFIGSSSAPYMNSLANQYGLATNYYANTHPSIGNYFMLTTGQILTNDDSQTPLSFPISADNVVRELLAAGKTWKAYAESIPSVGYVGGNATGLGGGFFYTRHVPLPYMTDVQNSTAQRQNIVPFKQFAVDLANSALPSYSFITPNGCDDAHDCSLSVADNWLKTNIGPLISSALFQKDGLLIIVFDESNTDNTNGGGQVPVIVISPFAKLGFKSTTFYQHESILRLMLEGLGVTTLPAAAASAPKMWEFFTFTPPT